MSSLMDIIKTETKRQIIEMKKVVENEMTGEIVHVKSSLMATEDNIRQLMSVRLRNYRPNSV
ncbi:hypothetical protein SK128_023096, partial [Halocaridina rubra]